MAMSHPSIMNASMAFDPETHVSLYSLVPGVPGRSLGIEVAQRLQLAPAVLERARELVPGSERRLGELLQDGERRRLELVAAEAELVESRESLAALLRKYRQRLGDVRSERARILDEARRRAEAQVEEAKALVHSARRVLRLAGDRAPGGAAAARQESPGRGLESLAHEVKEMSARVAPPARLSVPPAEEVLPEAVRAGDSYWVPDLGSLVEVVEPPDSAGRLVVRRGRLRLELGI
jgi:DNA mismatch repair protein MutS2